MWAIVDFRCERSGDRLCPLECRTNARSPESLDDADPLDVIFPLEEEIEMAGRQIVDVETVIVHRDSGVSERTTSYELFGGVMAAEVVEFVCAKATE